MHRDIGTGVLVRDVSAWSTRGWVGASALITAAKLLKVSEAALEQALVTKTIKVLLCVRACVCICVCVSAYGPLTLQSVAQPSHLEPS